MYGQQNPYAQPQPAPAPAGRTLPEEAESPFRAIGGFLDFVFAVVVGFLLARSAFHTHLHAGAKLGIAVLAIPLISFANQALLSRLTGCSIGKFLMATRVIDIRTSRRPTLWRLTVRWFMGGLIAGVVFIITVWTNEDVPTSSRDWQSPVTGAESRGGILIVRRKHLREWLGQATSLR
ncbi:RDD family protein [Kitasatospora sp. HPMI-4]|uniref:RDD family protein n=1 Tax=Kitasatospora sp. HPMI-4 TaxID=3448443 RepID=UPI003F1984F0